jgi:hypothetical protein
MNALLRVVALICAESGQPEASMQRAFSVIEAAMNESEEQGGIH